MDSQLTPCEERVVPTESRRRLTIGIPAEDPAVETRSPLTPQGVEILTSAGHKVVVERRRQATSRFTDEQYARAGAQISDSRRATLDADLVLKVAPPEVADVAQMRQSPTIACFAGRHKTPPEVFRQLADRRATLIATDSMTDTPGSWPVIDRALGEMEGQMAITTAAHLLEEGCGGKGIIVGGVTGVPPTEVVIVGADTAAFFAARAGLALGCSVKIFDTSHSALQSVAMRLPHHVFTSILHPQAMTKALGSADVIIGTRHAGSTPGYAIPAEHLALVKRGAVVVDLDASNGGRTEHSAPTSIAAPTYKMEGLTFHCLPDITTLAPHTATIVISDTLTPLIARLAEAGGTARAALHHADVQSAIAMFHGCFTNQRLARAAGAEYFDIKLLLV